jgi:hypothetical protein
MIGVGVSVKFLGKTVGAGPGNLAPIITSSPVTSATDGDAYSYQVQATDPEGGSLSYSLPTKPSGMTISGSGLVQWTPSSAGSEAVIVRVTDDKGAFTDQAYTITVAEKPDILGASIIVLAGGGGGGRGAGGGAGGGGIQQSNNRTIESGVVYAVTVGAGGSGAPQSTSSPGGTGGQSSFGGTGFSTLTSGGGNGGASNWQVGASSGSPSNNSGGSKNSYGAPYYTNTAGGGGGNGVAPNTNAGPAGGNAGIFDAGHAAGGLNWLSLGSVSGIQDKGYLGGGGGGGQGSQWSGGPIGNGGFGWTGSYNDSNTGRGGRGHPTFGSVAPQSSASGSGGGGGGGPYFGSTAGANGGSGRVIIKYAGTTQLATGGNVVVHGGNTYHVFNSSGNFQVS